jgi:predicted nucleic acid-binding Zn ribbon protein
MRIRPQCPVCGEPQVRRQLTAPQFRLAGGGWYETDFKKDGDKKRNLAGDGGSSSGDGGKTTESKPADSKPAESKPAEKKSRADRQSLPPEAWRCAYFALTRTKTAPQPRSTQTAPSRHPQLWSSMQRVAPTSRDSVTGPLNGVRHSR